jgi:hypothetical protein
VATRILFDGTGQFETELSVKIGGLEVMDRLMRWRPARRICTDAPQARPTPAAGRRRSKDSIQPIQQR